MRTKLLSYLGLALTGLLLSALVIAVPTPTFAIADPVNLQVLAVYVYEDCLEDGDTGVLIYYLIDYALNTTLPSETATEAYLFIFMDTDGTTQLKAASPYTFVDGGYGYGMAWIYFTASETATCDLDSINSTLYSVRLVGNPTIPSGWTGVPPTTSAGIDYWQVAGDTGVLVALRVLYYADQLELLWGLDMIQSTALGSKLTELGAEYFRRVIPELDTISPSAFSSSEYDPLDPDVDYTLEFGAIVTSGTATVEGSPITLIEGTNTAVAVNTIGSITAVLKKGTVGTATSGTGIVTGSPVELVAGTSTLAVTTSGTIIFYVVLNTTQTAMTNTIIGTGWDLTTLAVMFGMSRMWMSGIVWSVVTLLVCAAVYKKAREGNNQSAGKVTFLIFNVTFLGGIVIGMMPWLAGVLIFLGCDAFIGYILFFKPANV